MRRVVTAAVFCLVVIILQIPQTHACTSFCFDTPDGPVFGTNLDLKFDKGHVFINRRGIAKKGYGKSITGETLRWVSKYGSVTFNLVGRELPWGGMNEAGLVVSTMQLMTTEFPPADERPPVSSGTLVQYVLDTCGNIAEVARVDSLLRLADDDSHYLVTDATGETAVIEYIGGRMLFYMGDDLPVKALANAPYSACLTYVNEGVIPAFNPGASVERVAAADYESKAFDPEQGVSPVDYSMRILTETVVAPKKWWKDWFHEPYTRWSVVFDIGRREAYFRTVAAPDVKRLSLGSFDLSCDAPLKMLDVNMDVAGDVDDLFVPYDHDVNLKIFLEFCDKWGVEVTEEAIVELIRLFESFKCAP